MKPMLFNLVIAGMLAHQPALRALDLRVPAPSDPVQANFRVRISTATHLSDGRILAATADLAMTNQPVIAYASPGSNVCEPNAVTLERPAQIGAAGWQVEITPVRESAGQAEFRVHWRRLGSEKPAADSPSSHSATLKLRAGDRVVVDYVRSADPNVCEAVGRTLEVELQAATTSLLVEAELWLVRLYRDGSERSERQVVRFPVGDQPTSFQFNEARLGPTEVKPAAFLAEISGELRAIAIENGKIDFSANVVRRYPKLQLTNANVTKTYRNFVSASGEDLTLEFPLVEVPTFSTKAAAGQAEAANFEMKTLPPHLLRLRVKVLR